MYVNSRVLLPLPLDYQVVKGFEEDDDDGEIAYPLVLEHDETLASDGKADRLYGIRKEKSSSSAGAFVGLNEWKQELIRPSGLKIVRSSQIIESEDKLGIAMDWETKTAYEGMVYQIKMNLFKSWDELGERTNESKKSGFLAVCKKAPDFKSVPFLRLGGKNRPWILQELDDDLEIVSANEEAQIIEQIETTGIARLIFLSPAVWTEQSDFYHRENGSFSLNQELEFPILAEAIGRPMLLGGWDIARNAPKARTQAVPAGTVLYLKVEKEQVRKLVRVLRDAVLSDELGYEGYGWAVCGAGAYYKGL